MSQVPEIVVVTYIYCINPNPRAGIYSLHSAKSKFYTKNKFSIFMQYKYQFPSDPPPKKTFTSDENIGVKIFV